MKNARSLILTVSLVILASGCSRTDPIPDPLPPEPVTMHPDDRSFQAEKLFYQSKYISDALALEPDGAGILSFSFATPYTSVSYKYPSLGLDNPTPYLYATSETVPAGTDRISFHLEFPMTAEQTMPDEILDVLSVSMSGQVAFTFTLDPDFPFTKATVEQATITLPAWVQEMYPMRIENHKMQWPFYKTIHPGEVNVQVIYCDIAYDLQEDEGIREPGHRLVLDSTISIDGTLSVDESDRRFPEESPWSVILYSNWVTKYCSLGGITARMDLSREMEGKTLTFSRIPDFLKESGTVLDLDDLYGEIRVQNYSPAPISISGAIKGDDREYRFGERFSLPPFWAANGNGGFLGFLSEKGGRSKEWTDRYQDIPVSGFSGLIDKDPVSFALKDLRIENDTETPYRFVFDSDNRISIQAAVSSPLLIGKDFQVVHRMDIARLSETDQVTRIAGTMTVENTFPFDYEIRPVLYDPGIKVISVAAEPLRIPAGSREMPRADTFSFDWTVDAPVRYVTLELTGRTAENRQGETLHKDQHLAVKDITVEIY